MWCVAGADCIVLAGLFAGLFAGLLCMVFAGLLAGLFWSVFDGLFCVVPPGLFCIALPGLFCMVFDGLFPSVLGAELLPLVGILAAACLSDVVIGAEFGGLLVLLNGLSDEVNDGLPLLTEASWLRSWPAKMA